MALLCGSDDLSLPLCCGGVFWYPIPKLLTFFLFKVMSMLTFSFFCFTDMPQNLFFAGLMDVRKVRCRVHSCGNIQRSV